MFGNSSFSVFNWKSLFTRKLLEKEEVWLEEMISMVSPHEPVVGVVDRLVWLLDNGGLFSVKKLMHLLCSDGVVVPSFNFGLLWNLKVPPTVKSLSEGLWDGDS
ncbi:hypothetical protein V6N13_056873 [Hibiscus sabdariffa]|uniref:Uncharacterized protein n=2 Tax=Hibiscus sabdariffa TaxID=183260 RepID=A0ABR2AUY1_9ROSI